MINFIDKVSKTIEKYNMTDKSEQLLVCLSGGADSTALLLCLCKLGYNAEACHINHNLRGQESDNDQKFCEELCQKLGVKIHTYSIDVKAYCAKHSVSTEEGAREMRYKIFESIGADKICTAHTLSDRLETTVFNLSRGTGLKGLCSIPTVRDNIIRPLIECSRQEVEDFLLSENQIYVTDSSNLTDEYSRNKIRHNIIPVMEQLNSSLMKSFSDTIGYINDDNSFIEQTAKNAYNECVMNGVIKTDYFNNQHISIKSRIIMLWLDENNITFSHDRISALCSLAENGGKICISRDLYVRADKKKMYISKIVIADENTDECVEICGSGVYSYCGRSINVEIIEIDEKQTDFANVHKKFANCCMDYDKIKDTLLLHKRREGDRIQLVGRDFTSDVRKLVNKAFSAEKRDKAVLLYDSDGIVFVESYGVCDRLKITSQTRRILVFSASHII